MKTPGVPAYRERKLEAIVDSKGWVFCWKCSDCKWTKLADTPFLMAPTENTLNLFHNHECNAHRPHHDKKPPASISSVLLPLPELLNN